MTMRLSVVGLRSPMFDASMPAGFRGQQVQVLGHAVESLRHVVSVVSVSTVESAQEAREVREALPGHAPEVIVLVPLMAVPPEYGELVVPVGYPVVVWDVSAGRALVRDADQTAAHSETSTVGTLMVCGGLRAVGGRPKVLSLPPADADEGRLRAALRSALERAGPGDEVDQRGTGPSRTKRTRVARLGRPPSGYTTLHCDPDVLSAMNVEVVDLAPDELMQRVGSNDSGFRHGDRSVALRSRRLASALRDLAVAAQASAVAVNCHGDALRDNDAIGIVGCLAASQEIPVACTADIPTAWLIHMLALLSLPALYCEPYRLEDGRGAVLLANCGIGKRELCRAGTWREQPSQFCPGKRGRGLSVAMTVQNGPATFFSVAPRDGQWTILATDGFVDEGTLPGFGGGHADFKPTGRSPRQWMVQLAERGALHHGALALGSLGASVADHRSVFGDVEVCVL